VASPQATLQRLYRELDEPWFEHDFHNVEYEAPQYDGNIGLPGLHTVERVVAHRPRQPTIPPDLFAKYSNSHFWAHPELNTRSVAIL